MSRDSGLLLYVEFNNVNKFIYIIYIYIYILHILRIHRIYDTRVFDVTCDNVPHPSPPPTYDITPDDITPISQVPEGKRIQLQFEGDFSMYMGGRSSLTCLHWLEVQYNDDIGHPGPR